MAVVSKEDLLNRITAFIGEDKNDDMITLVEDVTDTFDDFDNKTKDATNWKQKYEENDKNWREKYISRFKQGVIPEEQPVEDDDRPSPKTFEELFSVKEK